MNEYVENVFSSRNNICDDNDVKIVESKLSFSYFLIFIFIFLFLELRVRSHDAWKDIKGSRRSDVI